jgi:hypothetical protein
MAVPAKRPLANAASAAVFSLDLIIASLLL